MIRPLLVRVVHKETGQVAREHDVPTDWTGPEIRQWIAWLIKVCGPDYLIETNGTEEAA